VKHLDLNLFNTVLKFPAVYILHVSLFLFSLSCSYDRGIIVKTDGIEKKGYIRFDECCDRTTVNKEGAVEFKESKISPWQKFSLKEVKRIGKEGDTYNYINSEKIKGDYGPSMYIPAKQILQGSLSVHRYCSIRYMNTMFSSNRMDLFIYLLSKKGENTFYVIPHDVEQFKIFSAEHLSSCPEVVNDIKNSKFKKKIKNPIPGNITDYEFVDESDISGFVSRYNECIEKKSELKLQ
jgi:hypothetical protein